MPHTAIKSAFVAMFVAAAALSVTTPGEAAQRPANAPSGRLVTAEQPQTGPAPVAVAEEADASRTRERLIEMLEKYPPALGRVLKLDPSLMTNQTYLAPYPALVVFLQQHPDIARNPGYFLERINVNQGQGYYSDPRSEARRELYHMIGSFTAFLVFLVVMSVLVWLIKMVADHRRWNKLSKVQFEVHNKLLDRFSTNEELLAYIQTPAGRRFLESAPIPLHNEARPLGAPFSRILWSVQAGVVAAIAGFGLLFVSWRMTDDVSQFFFVVGTVTLALGGGFIVSALAAYMLSRKLGLFDKPASDHA